MIRVHLGLCVSHSACPTLGCVWSRRLLSHEKHRLFGLTFVLFIDCEIVVYCSAARQTFYFHHLKFHLCCSVSWGRKKKKNSHLQDCMKESIHGCIISRVPQLTLWCACVQIDRRLCTESESYGGSGRVFPTVQLLPLRGGREAPTSPDVVRRSHGPGRHAWSWQHH